MVIAPAFPATITDAASAISELFNRIFIASFPPIYQSESVGQEAGLVERRPGGRPERNRCDARERAAERHRAQTRALRSDAPDHADEARRRARVDGRGLERRHELAVGVAG